MLNPLAQKRNFEMSRGVKTGTVRGSYSKNVVQVQYPAAYASKALDWKLRLERKAGHEFSQSVDSVNRTMFFEVRASRAQTVANSIRNLQVGGKHISVKVFARA